MSLQLWIPPKAVAYRCVCGKQFSDKQKGIRHAAFCGDADDELGEALEIRESDPISSHRPTDDEAWKWGRARMAEGRQGFKAGRPT